jgi:hypothetical protein
MSITLLAGKPLEIELYNFVQFYNDIDKTNKEDEDIYKEYCNKLVEYLKKKGDYLLKQKDANGYNSNILHLLAGDAEQGIYDNTNIFTRVAACSLFNCKEINFILKLSIRCIKNNIKNPELETFYKGLAKKINSEMTIKGIKYYPDKNSTGVLLEEIINEPLMLPNLEGLFEPTFNIERFRELPEVNIEELIEELTLTHD